VSGEPATCALLFLIGLLSQAYSYALESGPPKLNRAPRIELWFVKTLNTFDSFEISDLESSRTQRTMV
jgi:hypothetical protein